MVEPFERATSKFEESEIEKIVERYLKIGACSRCEKEEGDFISTVFLVPKKEGGNRLVINLKPLNKFIHCQKFKIEDYRCVRNMLSRNDYLCKIDIKDAYFMIEVHEKDRKFLKFRYEGELVKFNVLPFGLNIAPRVFTKLLKPVMSILRAQGFLSVIFIDDILVFAGSSVKCIENVTATCKLLRRLGFIINEEKSVLVPQQELQYLGFVFNTQKMSISLPSSKRCKIISEIRKTFLSQNLTILKLAELQGLLVSACPAVPYGQLYTRRLAIFIRDALALGNNDYSSSAHLVSEVSTDLTWWLNNIKKSEMFIRPDLYSAVIFTDASLTGWGAKIECKDSIKIARGRWTIEEKAFSINVLELLAIERALLSLANDREKEQILLRVDNTTAIAYINRFGGCHSQSLYEIGKRIWKWCEERSLWLYASYIKSAENKDADFQSRILDDNTEWKLNNIIFGKICENFGTPDIDLFASNENKQCDKFVSWFPCPFNFAVDAFTLDWGTLGFYAFPPFSLIPRVLRKICHDKAKGILIVPFWHSQIWYPKFVAMCQSEIIIFGPERNLLTDPHNCRLHPLWKSLQLAVAVVSGKCLNENPLLQM